MEDRQPAQTIGVEAPRREGRQPSGRGALAVFPVDVEQVRDRRLIAGGPDGRPRAAQPEGKRRTHAFEPLRPESGRARQASVVRRRFQVLQRLQPELVVQPRGQARADAGDRFESGDRVGLSPQAFEHREVPEASHVPHGSREPDADSGKPLQPCDAFVVEDVGHRPVEPAHRLSRTPVRPDAERVRALIAQQGGCLVEPAGHATIHREIRASHWYTTTAGAGVMASTSPGVINCESCR